MRKVKSTDVRVLHRATGLYLHVENLGRPTAENDVYTKDESDASVFHRQEHSSQGSEEIGTKIEGV